MLFSLRTPPLSLFLTSDMKDGARVSGDQHDTNIPDKNELFMTTLVLIHSLFVLKASRCCASHLQCEFLRARQKKNGTLRFSLTNWLVKVVHYTPTNKTAAFSAPAFTKWRSSNNALSASPAFGLSSNCILFLIYLPQQKRRGRQVIRIPVFDFSLFKGAFVNVGR